MRNNAPVEHCVAEAFIPSDLLSEMTLFYDDTDAFLQAPRSHLNDLGVVP